MNKKSVLKLILLFLCIGIYCLSPEEEYDFLIKDLYNYSTYAYKRTFDVDADKTDGIINLSQGCIQTTDFNLDIAIQGDGFFTVKDEKGNIYYTRYGKLRYDHESCSLYILVNNSKYFLDLKPFPKYPLMSDEIHIHRNGSVECIIPEESSYENDDRTKSISEMFELRNGLNGKRIIDNKEFNEITVEKKKEKKEIIDKIPLYNIDESNIDSYDGYLIKTKLPPKTIDNPHFIPGALELSNVYLDKVLIRMLFVIEKLDDNQIKQKETKKYLIQKMLDPNFIRVILFGYFYEEHPNLDDISGLKEYVHFLERSYE